MKMCEQILKKRQRPNTIPILWIVKIQDKANNSASYRCAATNKQNKFRVIKYHRLTEIQARPHLLHKLCVNWAYAMFFTSSVEKIGCAHGRK